ncbi:MAG TPA: hypothetical protein VHA14_11050, partial [Bryobacteraceae bacterium]|nr:hypothetical protein [Bryobacteraceae bacterium]
MNKPNQLERVRYWEGQLLASGDLREQMRSVAELRYMHNKALHSAYGIAMGLTPGEITDGALALGCGLAYDCAGRELIVPVDRQIPLPVPNIQTPHLLTISYTATPGQPNLSWQPQGQPMESDTVVLARILPGAPPTLDPAFQAVIARPLARPQLAGGQTVPGNTPWELWD